MKSCRLFFFLLVSLASIVPVGAMTDSAIVVSVKPLHSLVANITKGISTPILILSAPTSPHTYTLKPSNAAALSKAKLIFWIGPQLETFLLKPITTLNRNAIVISFPPPDKSTDPHIWLDPLRVKKMVRKIASALIPQDQKNTALYQANLQNTLNRLDTLDQKLKAQLADTKPFLVFHNAYSYLAERYNLKIVGSLVNNPEIKPGAKRIRQIRQILETSDVTCLFSEPQFNRKIITALLAESQIKIGTLDPLGSDIPPGSEHYFTMMQQLADNLTNCR